MGQFGSKDCVGAIRELFMKIAQTFSTRLPREVDATKSQTEGEKKLYRFKRTSFQNICDRYWGFVPLCGVMFAGAVLYLLQVATGWTLRTAPREILCVLGAIGIIIFLLWINFKLWQITKKRENKPFWLCIVRNVLYLASIAGVLVFGLYFVILMAFAHTPEHVVEKNGIKMVASVNSFLDMNVDYYAYKNPLFYGKNLGHEWYGSGGGDPLDADPPLEPNSWMFYDLDGNIIDRGERGYANMYGSEIEKRLSDPMLEAFADPVHFDPRVQKDLQSGVLTFSSPLSVYIDSYNGSFYKEKQMRYFPPSQNWQWYRYGIAHGNPLLKRWYFTENTADTKCPTVSVYTAGTAQNVWKTELIFDTYAPHEIQSLQQDLFHHSMRVFFEDTTYKVRGDTYQILEQSARENVCRFPSDTVPGYAVKTLCYQGSVGIYAYVINDSELHICFVPLTEELLREYERQGVTLYDIAKEFKR